MAQEEIIASAPAAIALAGATTDIGGKGGQFGEAFLTFRQGFVRIAFLAEPTTSAFAARFQKGIDIPTQQRGDVDRLAVHVSLGTGWRARA